MITLAAISSTPLGMPLSRAEECVVDRVLRPLQTLFDDEMALWAHLSPSPSPEVHIAQMLASARAVAAWVDVLSRQDADGYLATAPMWLNRLMAASLCENVPTDLAVVIGESVSALGLSNNIAGSDIGKAWALFQSLRPVALPTAALMMTGSDSRLDLNPETGLNRYGCSPFPQNDLLCFSSSTANPLSPLGLHAAEELRHAMMAAAARQELPAAVESAVRRLKTRILAGLGLAGLVGVEPVLAASGTIATLLAGWVALCGHSHPVLVLLLEPTETGSGIPQVAAGRHPASRTPKGIAVEEGAPIAGFGAERLTVEAWPIRDASGAPIDSGLMTERLTQRIAQAVAAGQRVILHALEGSKTGLTTPSLSGVQSLRAQFPDDLTVIVDACQMRLRHDVLLDYLQAGCLVVATGSKFLGGPPFSGVLLTPPGMSSSDAIMPAGLEAYSWRGDWPQSWAAAQGADGPEWTLGLLLRWQAALAELDHFNLLSSAEQAARVRRFHLETRESFGVDPIFAVAPSDDGTASSTIVTIGVADPSSEGWLGMEALRRLYGLLAQDVSSYLPNTAALVERRLAGRICLIGQPVALAGPIPAGLRIAIGAHQLAECSCGFQTQVIAEKIRLLLRDFPQLSVDRNEG